MLDILMLRPSGKSQTGLKNLLMPSEQLDQIDSSSRRENKNGFRFNANPPISMKGGSQAQFPGRLEVHPNNF